MRAGDGQAVLEPFGEIHTTLLECGEQTRYHFEGLNTAIGSVATTDFAKQDRTAKASLGVVVCRGDQRIKKVLVEFDPVFVQVLD